VTYTISIVLPLIVILFSFYKLNIKSNDNIMFHVISILIFSIVLGVNVNEFRHIRGDNINKTKIEESIELDPNEIDAFSYSLISTYIKYAPEISPLVDKRLKDGKITKDELLKIRKAYGPYSHRMEVKHRKFFKDKLKHE